MVAIGDEHFLPLEQVMIPAGQSAGGDRTQIRARLRLGQVHRAGPFAADHLRQKTIFQIIRRMQQHGFNRALGQQRAQTEGHIRRMHQFMHCARHQPGQALAAVFGREGQAVPTAGDELPVRILPALRQHHLAVHQLRALAVAQPVQRREHLGGEFAGLGQHALNQPGIDFFAAGQLPDFFQIGKLGGGEQQVTHRRGERHQCSPPALKLNTAPLRMPEGQRAVTVLSRV